MQSMRTITLVNYRLLWNMIGRTAIQFQSIVETFLKESESFKMMKQCLQRPKGDRERKRKQADKCEETQIWRGMQKPGQKFVNPAIFGLYPKGNLCKYCVLFTSLYKLAENTIKFKFQLYHSLQRGDNGLEVSNKSDRKNTLEACCNSSEQQ